ncbi:MAG: polynucleotide adenylyltransferase PcnB [Holophagales bacterium]|nr:polynucleotide adenylyltransferase PcnB [Holophagales bacterium]MXX60368.1 polynucleotide adenylyltransferase PcnB [Holophagales bacterium]MYC11588.1 polynucleotide adenylyltransferase PcnB [Holophagales bacterium]MYD21447.1 polynucleotide adenylyltransferase PcnB [Holophagales bacterium]MYI32701.1 polynucleotide adenylyltransferase PcnB [Holophagales bacterium]
MEAPAPATVLPRSKHPIASRRLSTGAQKVLRRLLQSGRNACLVGGSVRDLMLDRRPKDYDVVTDARPEEVRRLFRNSRIIGRRFRLVHVLFAGEVVEVSTFRGAPDPDDQRRSPGELLVTSDNTYGTPRQDAFRRDFTVNALLYRASDRAVVDYVGGIQDLEHRALRVIGDPNVRYREDPVRMLRACEFAARLDFEIEDETLGAAFAHRRDLVKASPHRLIEELLQLLSSGRSAAAFDWMGRSGLLPVVLPEVDEVSGQSSGSNSFSKLGRLLDKRVRVGPEVPTAVLLSSLLLPRVVVGRDRLEAGGAKVQRRRLHQLVDDVVADFGERFALSAARRSRMKKTLETFQRLCEEPRSSRTVQSLVRREAFGSALELFALLSSATGSGAGALEAWQRHAAAAPAGKPEPVARPRPRRRRRRRRRRHL